MVSYLHEPRSKDWYDGDDDAERPSGLLWYELLLMPVVVVGLMIFSFLTVMGAFLGLLWVEGLSPALTAARETVRTGKVAHPGVVGVALTLALGLGLWALSGAPRLPMTLSFLAVLAAIFAVLAGMVPAGALILHGAFETTARARKRLTGGRQQ